MSFPPPSPPPYGWHIVPETPPGGTGSPYAPGALPPGPINYSNAPPAGYPPYQGQLQPYHQCPSQPGDDDKRSKKHKMYKRIAAAVGRMVLRQLVWSGLMSTIEEVTS
ncbi:submaxillary gland androgen-regulated protein 3A-like [Oryzias melastigma]|uniref:submaxillary gland androgen-regulated protein 3A-like n=1 Tax=Oryzias melastigma TaxID=30732 RepID=UPI000CF7CEDF|nr:submaxillary gland androgen-regulated protein 3A-like [Oryzias melastigma]